VRVWACSQVDDVEVDASNIIEKIRGDDMPGHKVSLHIERSETKSEYIVYTAQK
jgi:hypothetical protein